MDNKNAADALYSTLEQLANERKVEICGGFTPVLTGSDDEVEVRFHFGHKMVVIGIPHNGRPVLSLVNLEKVDLTGTLDEIERDMEVPSPY